uniref:Transposase n=1 Tax=Rhizobium leguminosarum TaxID=384 RepID=A0A154IEJ7_RHILE|nr:hypothetical protein A4A59_24940 [Rhizobium leguminosarum]
MSKTTNKFSPEVRAPAKIGCTAQTLSGRVKKAGVDNDFRPGLPSDVAERMKSLERENRELRQANEIFAQGVSMFRDGGARPPIETMISFIDEHRAVFGSSRSSSVLKLVFLMDDQGWRRCVGMICLTGANRRSHQLLCLLKRSAHSSGEQIGYEAIPAIASRNASISSSVL